MKIKLNNMCFKVITLLLVFILILSDFLMPIVVSAMTKVVQINNSAPFTVRVNDENINNSINSIPLFDQMDYPNVEFGEYGTLESYGCGLVAMAMVATYLMDEFQDPIVYAKRFGRHTTPDGSLLTMFGFAAEELGLIMDISDHPNQEWDDDIEAEWDHILAAIKNGQPVIALYRGDSLFSDGGHFVVITGMTNDGKFTVNDPNGWNWARPHLVEGFTNGFTEEQIRNHAWGFWIYSTKEEYQSSLIS